MYGKHPIYLPYRHFDRIQIEKSVFIEFIVSLTDVRDKNHNTFLNIFQHICDLS